MALVPGVETQETNSGASGEDQIESLLSGDLKSGTDGAGSVAEDTSVADADHAAEEEETGREGTDEGATDEASADDAGGTAETEEEELTLTESDRDFSESAYTRAAAHYAKTTGKTLDPNDKGDRALLHELMQRGEDFKRLKAAQEAAAKEEEVADEGAATEEAKPTAPVKPTFEQIKPMLTKAQAYVKETLLPEVAMEMGKGFVEALWPGKKLGEKLSQENAQAIAEWGYTWMTMAIADAMPSIMQAVPQAAVGYDPMFARVRDTAMKESAIDEIRGVQDKGGNTLFPDFESLVDNGTIKKMLATDELKSAVFDKNPYKNYVAKLKMAYRLAKGQKVDVGALEKATTRGREAERERQARVGAGKLPPGSSRGSFAPPSTGDFVDNLVSNSGRGKFAAAIARSQKK